jgi:hypothetical protein
MPVRVHRSEGPIPRERSHARRQRRALEERGQLALDWSQPCCGVSGGAAPAAKMPEAPPHTKPAPSVAERPSVVDCAREPWRAFE